GEEPMCVAIEPVRNGVRPTNPRSRLVVPERFSGPRVERYEATLAVTGEKQARSGLGDASGQANTAGDSGGRHSGQAEVGCRKAIFPFLPARRRIERAQRGKTGA